MKITIWSLKGGVGKTSIALNLALSCDCSIITNERYTLLDKVLSKENLLQLQVNQEVPILPINENVIFDMGGYSDKRIIGACNQSRFILVPTTASDIDLQGCISTLIELKKFVDSDKIIIIANKINNESDFNKIKAIIEQIDNKYSFFEIKNSKALVNIYDEKKSINDIIKARGLKSYSYKHIGKQFNNLINFLNNNQVISNDK